MIFRILALCYSAGTVGALANSAAIIWMGKAGIPASLGVALAPNYSPSWLYPRLVWGGMWALLFALPLPRTLWWAFVIALAPALFQLFVVFPQFAGKGTAGLDLGTLTPAFVLFYNLIWALVTYLTLKLVRA